MNMPRGKSGIKGVLTAFLIREGKKRILPYVLHKIKDRNKRR